MNNHRDTSTDLLRKIAWVIGLFAAIFVSMLLLTLALGTLIMKISTFFIEKNG